MSQRTWAFCLSFLLLASVGPARAIIVITDAKGPDGAPFTVTQIYTNQAAYTGSSYADSGSQYEGNWRSAGGTAIAPNWFITSTHVQGNPGDDFVFNDGSVHTVVKSVDVGNQMTIWEVSTPFSRYAPIVVNSATSNAQANQITSAFGFGLVPDLSSPVKGPDGIQGYQWGGSPSTMSWGLSRVFGYANDLPSSDTFIYGKFLPADGTGQVSSTFATLDSGGGTFVNTGTQWGLAGVNFGSTFQYTGNAGTTPSGTFNGAVWDGTGFVDDPAQGNGPQLWVSSNIDAAVYANILANTVPEPASLGLLASGLGVLILARLRSARRRARLLGPAPLARPKALD